MPNPKYEAALAVVEMGSLKKAAESLGYTQTGVSYLINSLEEELGVELFVRNYGGTVLTAEGKLLLPYIRSVCNCENLLMNKVHEIKNLSSGLLRIGSFSSVHTNWLPAMVKEYQKHYPGVEVEMKCCDDYDRLEEMICSGEVDCGFVVLPAKKKMKGTEFYEDPVVAVVGENHPLADEPCFPASKLDQYPYIQSLVSSEREVDDIFERYGKKADVAYRVDNDFTMLSMISSGFGFAIFPELLLRHLNFPILAKSFNPPESRKIGFAIRAAGPAASAIKSFQETAEAWLEEWMVQ